MGRDGRSRETTRQILKRSVKRRVSSVRAYLSPDIVKGRRADDGEADEEDVGLRV